MKNAFSPLLTRFRALSAVWRVFLAALGVAACLLSLARFGRPTPTPGPQAVSLYQQTENWPTAPEPDNGPLVDVEKHKDQPELQASAGLRAAGSPIGEATSHGTPLIAHTAELAVATKEFAKSRSSLEEILERHRGYASRLRMAGRRTGSVLSAMLRIPSTELGGTVSDLKSLGEVEQEEQAADEITQQRAELEARLSNAQGTLRRLQELLTKQTYPDGNVRELQRQIANASAEVNRLEAERQASEHRVIFANVQFSLREVLAQPEESLVAQLRAASAAGFSEAAASLSAILLFLIGRGPIVVLWIAILYVPARFVWRRWQPATVRSATGAAEV